MLKFFFLNSISIFLYCLTFINVCNANELPFKNYKIGHQDVLQIVVYGEAELSGEYKVDPSGHITMPLVGTIEARNLSTHSLADHLHDAFADGFLINPDIQVSIATYRPFYILGEIRLPGEYPYSKPMTVRQAVAMAGGFTYRAQQKNMTKISNASDDRNAIIDIDAMIMPGDTIIVKERFF